MKHLKKFENIEDLMGLPKEDRNEIFINNLKSHFVEIEDTFDVSIHFFMSTVSVEFNDEWGYKEYSLKGATDWPNEFKPPLDDAINRYTEFIKLLEATKKVLRKLELSGLYGRISTINRKSDAPPDGVKIHLKREE
jgi:hypothetical protein